MKSKKGVLVLLVSSLLFSVLFIFAQDQTQIDKAYTCFETELNGNCGDALSTKQAAFNLLAGSYKSSFISECKKNIKDKQIDNCWGETDAGLCNIKFTALAALSLHQVNDDIDKPIDYLLSKRITDTGLTWYLEIDTNNKSECDINGKKFTIDENKKIIGSAPQGLIKAYNDYWFEIKDINKNYTISCDSDFLTALVYQKPDSSAFHISSETKTASEFGIITEKVNSYCFSMTNKCDYEGSLWAALLLAKLGEDVSSYLPYLTATADKTENRKFIPSAFLYILTNSDDYYNDVVSLQKTGNYWDESRNKLYDTSIALLALGTLNSNEIDGAKRYLLSNQKENGCWPSDTSFILHAVFPKKTIDFKDSGTSLSFCEDFGNFCVSLGQCTLQNTMNNFYCASSSQVCCKEDFQEPSCAEKEGIICKSTQQCEGESIYSSDGECCVGDCVEIDTEPECEKQGFICKSSCADKEEEKISYSNSCSFGDVCCGRLPVEEKGTNWWLIILLVILIILVILAILYRNQLKVWMFKRKAGLKTKPVPPTRPTFTPQPIFPARPLPPTQRPQMRPTAPRRDTTKDKEFEDTMKKLRDMSK
ncbi:hypothetical protein J4456_02430 [Candidatus Pacearchaeota archaeon]|nr:hypothetical protein [Candidatus Pacearchaeota archaeon]